MYMKKITFTEEQINDIIGLYENKKTTRSIGGKFNVSKRIISRILNENGIELRNSGRQFEGGKPEADKRYYKNNKEKKLKICHEWQKNNREHLRNYHKKWRTDNIEKHRENKRNYEKRRKSEDPTYKLICNFRTAIYTVLKEQNLTKRDHYFDMLGYTQGVLIEQLEKQFKDGITWKNYGEWHVDHKRPISSFKLTDVYDEEFQKCWSLDNLQPMLGKENISKGNRYEV